MTTNPYAPPCAPVADVFIPQGKPAQIVLAVRLIWASLAVGSAYFVAASLMTRDVLSVGPLIAGLLLGFSIGVLPPLFLAYKIDQGRNWARITLLVLVGVGLILPFFVAGIVPTTLSGRVVFGLESLMQITAIALTFIGPGRHWFQHGTHVT
jgi:hypothetical protein